MKSSTKYLSPIALLLSLSLLAAAAAAAEPASERLRPWASLPDGAVPADEAALASAPWSSASRDALAPRLSQTINRDWAFNYFPDEKFDEKLASADLNDAAWSAVALPHTWQCYETTGEVHPYIMNASERDSKYWWYGWGVYRKQFTLDPAATKDRKVFAEFDGVMKYCRVYLNGKFLGEHKGGYASFYFDLTDHLNPTGPNVLTVAVNNRRDDPLRIPPMTAGNFNVYGGIYRDVRLVVKDRVYIPFQGAYQHEGGTFITTPQLDDQHAVVRVRTWVRNETPASQEVSLVTTIRDPSGKTVATSRASSRVNSGELHEFDRPGIEVAKPELWSPETPRLYTVLSEVFSNGNLVDRYESPLGFRRFEWDYKQNRAILNGKMIHLHGTNRHQEFPWLGDAIPKWMHVRDLLDMRFGQGHNFARFCHYTQDALVYDLADRYGLLVCEETPSIKDLAFDPEVQRQQVIEMIRRDRNHPSIVMWSMGNETSHPADSAWGHAEDDTRILHLRHGKAGTGGQFITHTDKNMDMENLLRCTIRGWTDREVASLEPANGQQTGHEEWQHQQARIEGASQRGRIDMPNGNMWIYADHGADREYANSPLLHINPKGWVDIYRIPKYMYYLWQANYAAAPMVFIHPHAWQAKNLGRKLDIIVDSNCESVELKVNGRSVGTLKPTPENFHTVTFSGVTIEQGTLEAVGAREGKQVASRVVMSGEPARLTLSASHPALEAAADQVVVLTADVVDAAGVPVQGFSRDLKWSVQGPARLITPEVYKSDLSRRGGRSGSFYIVAPVCALIRATGEPGEITVTVSSAGLDQAELKLKAQAERAPEKAFVKEVKLTAAGRKPLAHDPNLFNPAAPVAGPFKPAADDINLPARRNRAFYEKAVDGYFKKASQEVPRHAEAYPVLRQAFAETLASGAGVMVADDINHYVNPFNDYCRIEDAVNRKPLPEAWKKEIKVALARQMLREEGTLRVEDALKWIRALPDNTPSKRIDHDTPVSEIFRALYPEANEKTKPGQAALRNFLRINAGALKAAEKKARDRKAKTVTTLRAGSTILTPPLETLK